MAGASVPLSAFQRSREFCVVAPRSGQIWSKNLMKLRLFSPDLGIPILAFLGMVAVTMPTFSEETLRDEPIQPIPETVEVDPKKVQLGKALYHETRLSKDQKVSCASCHILDLGGVDRRKHSIGVFGQEGPINSPTVFNSIFLFRLFWDGRAATLEEQIGGPIQKPKEMGMTWPEVLKILREDPDYRVRFEALYSDGVTEANVKDAIAEFERSLITPNSPFDRYLKGDDKALNAQEKRGYTLFKYYGCISCHQGVNVGGNLFQIFGVVNDYFGKRGNLTEADLGRYNVTGNKLDKHMFKVPSLRMAAVTPPYLHDGKAKTLRDAVDIMFEFQLGRTAPDEDKEAIVAFIKTLVGDYKGKGL